MHPQQALDSLFSSFQDPPCFPDGRIDFTNLRRALVINCFIQYGDKFLLVKRSDKVGTYKLYWSTLTGYLDEPGKLLEEKVFEEFSEELSISSQQISSLASSEPFSIIDEVIKKEWITFALLATFTEQPNITLNWENIEFKWVSKEEFLVHELVPGLAQSFRTATGHGCTQLL